MYSCALASCIAIQALVGLVRIGTLSCACVARCTASLQQIQLSYSLQLFQVTLRAELAQLRRDSSLARSQLNTEVLRPPQHEHRRGQGGAKHGHVVGSTTPSSLPSATLMMLLYTQL